MDYLGFDKSEHFDRISLYRGDCMDLMKQTPDKYYDLAIVDPPFGIGISSNPIRQQHKKKSWDSAIPDISYFLELYRISKNQIIWGGNYFDLPPTQCFYIWDKKQPHDFSLAMCEMAWTSFKKPAKMWSLSVLKEQNKIHPTQKPVELYDWLIQNNAKQGDKILDTHGGSMSIALAVHKANQIDKMNISLTLIELDEEYFKKGLERFENFRKQQFLF